MTSALELLASSLAQPLERQMGVFTNVMQNSLGALTNNIGMHQQTMMQMMEENKRFRAMDAAQSSTFHHGQVGGIGLDQASLNAIVAAVQSAIPIHHDEPQFVKPDSILQPLDKDVKEIVRQVGKHMKKHIDLKMQYAESERKYADSMHTKLQDEQGLIWQWPQEFKVAARETSVESQEQKDDINEYDIDQAWQRLRQECAERCMTFIREQNSAIKQFFDEKSKIENVFREAELKLNEFWHSEIGSLYKDSDKRFIADKAKKYLETERRQHLAAHFRRQNKKEESKKKRDEALLQAQSLYESADSTTLTALAKLAVIEKNADPSKFREGTLMHFMCQQQPEVVKKFMESYNKARDKPRHQQRGRPQVKVKGRSPSRKGYPKTPATSRSSSKSRRSTNAKSSKGSSRSRSFSIASTKSSRRSASNSSKRSASSSRKGKGKGKGKKPKGKGKGKTFSSAKGKSRRG